MRAYGRGAHRANGRGRSQLVMRWLPPAVTTKRPHHQWHHSRAWGLRRELGRAKPTTTELHQLGVGKPELSRGFAGDGEQSARRELQSPLADTAFGRFLKDAHAAITARGISARDRPRGSTRRSGRRAQLCMTRCRASAFGAPPCRSRPRCVDQRSTDGGLRSSVPVRQFENDSDQSG